jgi:hypothetical protein
MREADRVVDGSQDWRSVHFDPGHLLVVIKEADDVIASAAANRGQNLTCQAAGGDQQKLTHRVSLPLPGTPAHERGAPAAATRTTTADSF